MTNKDTIVVGDEFDYLLVDKCKTDPLKTFTMSYKKGVWFTASDPSRASGAFKLVIENLNAHKVVPEDKKLKGRADEGYEKVDTFEKFFAEARGVGAVVYAKDDQVSVFAETLKSVRPNWTCHVDDTDIKVVHKAENKLHILTKIKHLRGIDFRVSTELRVG